MVFVIDRKIDCGTIAWRGSTFCGVGDDNRVGQNLTCATASRALEIRFTAVALLQSAPVERDSICFSPLSGAKGIRSDLPNCREVRQADRRCVISTFQVAGAEGVFLPWVAGGSWGCNC